MKNFIMVIASMIFIFAAAMLVGNGTENKEIGTCVGCGCYEVYAYAARTLSNEALMNSFKTEIHVYQVKKDRYSQSYTEYRFNTETGEWSDGGNYVIHAGYLCEVGPMGERTKVGQIIAQFIDYE